MPLFFWFKTCLIILEKNNSFKTKLDKKNIKSSDNFAGNNFDKSVDDSIELYFTIEFKHKQNHEINKIDDLKAWLSKSQNCSKNKGYITTFCLYI